MSNCSPSQAADRHRSACHPRQPSTGVDTVTFQLPLTTNGLSGNIITVSVFGVNLAGLHGDTAVRHITVQEGAAGAREDEREIVDERMKRGIRREGWSIFDRSVRVGIGQSRDRQCLDNPGKPIGVFMFAGTSGTGKTETALALAETLGDFKKITTRGGIPVWLPTRLCEKDRRIPRDWSITSDGLAARLAERLDARSIVLVKSTRVAAGTPLSDVVKSGIADPAFADIVARAKLDWRILGPGEEQALAELIGAKI